MPALSSGFTLVPAAPWPDALLKMALVGVTVILVNIGWSLLGAGLTHRLRNPRQARAINSAFALLLVASVALTLRF